MSHLISILICCEHNWHTKIYTTSLIDFVVRHILKVERIWEREKRINVASYNHYRYCFCLFLLDFPLFLSTENWNVLCDKKRICDYNPLLLPMTAHRKAPIQRNILERNFCIHVIITLKKATVSTVFVGTLCYSVTLSITQP